MLKLNVRAHFIRLDKACEMKATTTEKVLEDCSAARKQLAKALADEDIQAFRLAWVLCLTLLRSVGHVLRKVDAPRFGADVVNRLDRSFKDIWSKERIFVEFIERDRNAILKTYELNLDLKSNPRLLTFGGRVLTFEGKHLAFGKYLKAATRASGYKAGASPVEIVDEAILWWKSKLRDFDNF